MFPHRYNESCLHGCIIVSKILFLAESCRDCIDIKLSKDFNAASNILGVKCLMFILRDVNTCFRYTVHCSKSPAYQGP